MAKRKLEANDIYQMRIPSDPRVSPTDDRVVYTLKYVDRVSRKTFSNLWMVRPDQAAQPFTRGLHRDHSARWSPDGRQIAFLSTRTDDERKDRKFAGKKSQLAIMPADGGEPWIVTDVDGTIVSFEWYPCGTRILLSLRKSDPLPEGEDSPVALRITRLRYKIDGLGYYPQDKFHLYSLALHEGAEPVALTQGDWDDTGPVISPDGKWIAFMSNRRNNREFDDENRDLYIMPADGGEPRQLSTVRGAAWYPIFSPDGRRIVWLKCAGPQGNSFYDNTHLFAYDLESGQEWDLTPDLDRSAINVTIAELYGLEHLISHPSFTPDGRAVTFIIGDSGRSYIARVGVREPDAPQPAIERVYDTESVVHFQQAKPGGPMTIITTSPKVPAHVLISDADGKRVQRLLDPNEWLSEVALVDAEDIHAKSADGTRIHGWLMQPEGKGKAPLILSIHGGPHLAFGVPFAFEFQYLVANGYAVVFGNPRGSHGYGLEFARSVFLDWADKPFEDLNALVDEALTREGLDKDRLGVCGGSYGGYMTLWILSHSRRFKAGCAQRPVSDLTSMTWSDFGGFMDWLFGAFPWQDPALFRRLSPIEYLKDVEAPVLLIQGLADQRTPTDQAERAYVALRHFGKTTEMLLFPGADHHLSRTGRPSQQIARLDAIRDWFDRYM